MADSVIVEGYLAYLDRATQEGCRFISAETDTPAMQTRRGLLQHELENAHGLPSMSISKLETHFLTVRFVEDVLEEHEGQEDLDFHALMTRYWNQPNHQRDLPILATRLIPNGCMTRKGERELVEHAWTHPEFPVVDIEAQAGWIDVFEYVGYLSDDGSEQPTEPITLYRGGSANFGGTEGLSWTSDPEKARWFAYRFGTAGRAVWVATVEPDQVLARFGRRNESEYVIDPLRLEPVEYAHPGAPRPKQRS